MGRDLSSFGLKDQVAIVTGASEGIGRRLAVGLAEAGAHVAVVARTVSKLEAVAAEIEALGRKALVAPTDLTQVAQIQAMVAKVNETFGRVDILVNDAAWTGTGPAFDVTEEEWDRTLDTSLKAMFFASQAAARIMAKQGRGKIINVGSTFGVVAFKDRAIYAAAKAGVHHMTQALALEWASLGVYVNAIGPCVTETPSRRNIFERPGYVKWVTEEMLPIGRWAQPDDMLGPVLFLASPFSDMVVGHVLMVDGGWTLH